MKRLAFLTILATASLFSHVAAEEPKPLKALMVCGGCCHDYEAQKKILSEGITARANVAWTIVHEGIPVGKDDARNTRVSIYEKPNWWAGYDVVVHNECFGSVADNAFVEGIAAAHKAGVPAVMLHCSTHSYRMATTDEWRMALGITSRSHEKRRDLKVRVMKADHPVMKGFPAEWLDKDDELYKNEKIWPTATPLAQAYGEDTKQDHVCIWLNQYGKARVFVTTLGHFNATMESEEYLGLVTRGLLWTCDKLTDDGTPKAGFAPAKK
jgi:type 1 glutamine amidotransferase